MKVKEIKELSTAEIQERIVSEVALLNQLKLNHSISPLDNPMQIKDTRKTIARLKTELSQRNN